MTYVPRRLLQLVGPLHVAAGLLLFATGFSPAAQKLLESVFSAAGELDWSPFFLAVLGPTIASWGVLFSALTKQFFVAPTAPLWRAMLASLLVWAPLDTLLCLKFGLYSGAILNGIVFAGILALLLSARTLLK